MHGLQEIIAMNNNDEAPHAPSRDKVREYVLNSIASFIGDPPETEFQRGYLSALCAVAKEGFHEDMSAFPYAEAEALVNGRAYSSFTAHQRAA